MSCAVWCYLCPLVVAWCSPNLLQVHHFANIININQQLTENNNKALGFCCYLCPTGQRAFYLQFLYLIFGMKFMSFCLFTHSTAASSAAHIMCVDRDHLQSTGLKWVATLFGHWSEVSEGILLKWGSWHSIGSYCWCYIQRKAKVKSPPVTSMLFLMLFQLITLYCADFDIIQLFSYSLLQHFLSLKSVSQANIWVFIYSA